MQQLSPPRDQRANYSYERSVASSIWHSARWCSRKDAPIVAAAIRARADYLATHDLKTLLRYKDEVLARLGVRLVQPHEVLNLLRRGH